MFIILKFLHPKLISIHIILFTYDVSLHEFLFAEKIIQKVKKIFYFRVT